MKLKASRLKLKIDPKICSELMETSSSSSPTSTSPSSSSSSSPISSASSTTTTKILTTSEQKKQARQIRNRQAAITSRQRYLADAESLKERVAKLEAENKSLHEQIAKLQSEKLSPSSSSLPSSSSSPPSSSVSDLKLHKLETYCAKEHATFYLRGISPTLTSHSHCREINLQ
jgi:hypothetical protein